MNRAGRLVDSDRDSVTLAMLTPCRDIKGRALGES